MDPPDILGPVEFIYPLLRTHIHRVLSEKMQDSVSSQAYDLQGISEKDRKLVLWVKSTTLQSIIKKRVIGCRQIMYGYTITLEIIKRISITKESCE